MEQERPAPQRVIGKIKLTEPKCSWQQLGRKGLDSGCDKGSGGACDRKNCGFFLCGPKAIYKTERRICHVRDAWRWKRGHNVKQHIIYSMSPAWVRTDKKDMFVICYIMQQIHRGFGISQGRSGEGKVRNVFKCKDHKFNTFHCASREAGGGS